MSSKKHSKFASVSIPVEIIREIDRIVKSGEGGYVSRAEFIKDAIRRYLEITRVRSTSSKT